MTGAKEVALLGKISSTHFKTRIGISVKQRLELYQCSDGANQYFILESTHGAFGGKRNYIKLTQESLREIDQLIKVGSVASHKQKIF
ncbi:hypothetical protein ACFL0Y_00440 [Patescibacteria group bacterium]